MGFFFFFFFFSRPQSSDFLQPARIEMLEKVSNSQAKPLSITEFPSQLIETPVFLPASKIPLGNRFVGCSCDLSTRLCLAFLSRTIPLSFPSQSLHRYNVAFLFENTEMYTEGGGGGGRGFAAGLCEPLPHNSLFCG